MYVCLRKTAREENETKKKLFRDKAIRLAEKIKNGCVDEYLRSGAIQVLCLSYEDNGEHEKAVALARSMPPSVCGSDELLYLVSKGNERFECGKVLIYNYIQKLSTAILSNCAPLDNHNAPYSLDEKAALRDKQIAFLNIMFENNDFGFFHNFLFSTHAYQARYYAIKKEKVSALKHLQAAVEHVLALQTFDAKEVYTSLLLRGTEFGNYMTNSTNKPASIVLDIISTGDFEFLQTDETFLRCKEVLQQNAGQWRI